MPIRSDVILRVFLVLGLIVLSFPAAAKKDAPVSPLTYEDEGEVLDQAHVRGFIWGLPSAIIKEEEKGVFAEEAKDGSLFYVDQIRGMKSSITYEFENKKLYRVQIFSEKKYPRPQARMQDLVRIKRDLDKRFGEPIKEDFEWLKNTDKKYPEQWGWAVYRGELNVTITWGDDETFVTAYLGAPKPFNPVLFVTYEDAKLKRAKAVKKRQETIQIVP